MQHMRAEQLQTVHMLSFTAIKKLRSDSGAPQYYSTHVAMQFYAFTQHEQCANVCCVSGSTMLCLLYRTAILERCLRRLEFDKARDAEAKAQADQLEAERMAMQSIDWYKTLILAAMTQGVNVRGGSCSICSSCTPKSFYCNTDIERLGHIYICLLCISKLDVLWPFEPITEHCPEDVK